MDEDRDEYDLQSAGEGQTLLSVDTSSELDGISGGERGDSGTLSNDGCPCMSFASVLQCDSPDESDAMRCIDPLELVLSSLACDCTRASTIFLIVPADDPGSKSPAGKSAGDRLDVPGVLSCESASE